MREQRRREFLGTLGATAVLGTGFTGAAVGQAPRVVRMGSNYFDPIGLHVSPGTTVRFEIESGAHSATAYPDRIPEAATAFDSGTIAQGAFEHTFDHPGTVDYFCIPHRSVGMVGRIVVGSPGGPAEDSPLPDGRVPGSDEIVDRGAIAYGSAVDGSGDPGGGPMGHRHHGLSGGGVTGRDDDRVGGLPVLAGALGTIGVLAGAIYWTLGRHDAGTPAEGHALAVLEERYASGEIGAEEFERRRERLQRNRE